MSRVTTFIISLILCKFLLSINEVRNVLISGPLLNVFILSVSKYCTTYSNYNKLIPMS